MVVGKKISAIALLCMFIYCHNGVDRRMADLSADLTDSMETTLDKGLRSRETKIRHSLKEIDSIWEAGDHEEAQRLYTSFRKSFPFDIPMGYLHEAPIAKLDEMGLNMDSGQSFFLDHAADVKIFATGEGMCNIKTSLLPPYFSDNLEMFFDMKNDKAKYFDRNGAHRQYFFTWHSKEVGGQNIATEGLEVGQADPSATSYTIEIKIPWKTLGYITPAYGLRIGFDVMIDDDDRGDLDAQMTWHSKSAQLSNRASHFGTLILDSIVSSSYHSNDMARAGYTHQVPVIDGQQDACWSKAPSYDISNLVLGASDGPGDLSGTFRTLWDMDNFYFFLRVIDDTKRQASALFDYGWIENDKGDTVWLMDVKNTINVGGAFKNRGVDTVIHLKAGKYKLRYVTDGSHSYGDWDDSPPGTSLYGIVIYFAK